MASIAPSQSLVSVEWLTQHIGQNELVILDASLPKPKSKLGDNPLENFQIKGARFFDIDHVFSDTTLDLPHMMPTADVFTREARKLGINRDSIIVVYDNLGIYSSPRAWWMFKAMGHEQVAVLDGGLPEWIRAGFPKELKQINPQINGDFIAMPQPEYFKASRHVMDAIDNSQIMVLDARSKGRFAGTEPEPRIGLRGGHIPNSVCLPFTDVVQDHKMLPKKELIEKFKALNISNQKLIFSCGSGLTACIITLAAHLAGYEHLSVYDGSWSEWGQSGDLPIEQGNQ